MVSGAGSHTLSLSCSGKPNMPIITLSVSSLKYTNLKDRDYPTFCFLFFKEKNEEKNSTTCCLQETHFRYEDIFAKIKGMNYSQNYANIN